MRIRVTLEDYQSKFADHTLVKIFSIANVKETHQTWSEEDDFLLIKPNLVIHVSIKVTFACIFEVTFSINSINNLLIDIKEQLVTF